MQRRSKKQIDELLAVGGKWAFQASKHASKTARQAKKTAGRVGEYISERAEDLSDDLSRRMRSKRSLRGALGIFAAGFCLGFGVTMLVTPKRGRQVRADITQATADVVSGFQHGYSQAVRQDASIAG